MVWMLTVLLAAVLVGPFLFSFAERYLEFYLFWLGLAAILVAGVFNEDLFFTALREPVAISCAVLVAGWLFRIAAVPFQRTMHRAENFVPTRLLVMLLVFSVGIISSIITAIIAAVLLASVAGTLSFNKASQIRFVIFSCYAIGLGAVLTPIGEPLSTIATSRLNESFFFLMRILGTDVLWALLLLAILAGITISPKHMTKKNFDTIEKENWSDIVVRTVKVYIFVIALTFLGAGFEPLLGRMIEGQSPELLYWMNIISAVLDNATLASIELSPTMEGPVVRAILMGLLISGGMLIPGNIPNIIAAGKLSITSKEWARFSVPFGLIIMIIYFFLIVI